MKNTTTPKDNGTLYEYMPSPTMFKKIFIESLPVIGMVVLIPFIKNDYTLTGIYAIIIALLLSIKKEKGGVFVFIFGFVSMIFFETLFISTGVETFIRNSLFGIMPLWLPFLWGYGFIAIRRGVQILVRN
jgi:hypothetical protein